MSEVADWFMLILERMARALGYALNKLIGLKQSVGIEASNEFIVHYLQTEFDLSITELLKIENNKFVEYLKTKHIHQSHLEIFSKILYETSETLTNKDEERNLLLKSQTILNYLNQTDKIYSIERQKFLTTLTNTIQQRS